MFGAGNKRTDRLIDLAEKTKTVATPTEERRTTKRLDYDALVALILLTPEGEKTAPILLRAKDISRGGIRVVGRQQVESGQSGAVQLVRSNGQVALIGIRVQHCERLDGSTGYELGLQFAPLPAGLSPDDFLDDQRLKLLDPLLRGNIEE